MVTLDLRGLTVKYGQNTVIDSISASFRGGEMAAVIGRNGIGKTTLVKAIAGLVRHSGTIRLAEDGRACSARDIAYVPQMGSSAAKLTVFEMVLLGLVKDLRWKVRPEQIETVEATLRSLGLDHLAGKSFHTISGGQKQLVFLAQSFVAKPKVLLLDEPTSALDLRYQLVIMDRVRSYTRETGAVTIFIAHDLMLSARYSDTMVLLDGGRIRTQGSPQSVLRPELLESVYSVKVNVERNSLGQFSVIPQTPVDAGVKRKAENF